MRPRILPVAERVARFAYNRGGMRSRYVETRAGRIHAYDAEGTGDLPTMVLLHGIGSAATSYGPLLTRLRRHARRVVAPELPGHGFSAEPAGTLTPERLYQAVRDAIDLLAPEPIVLTGHSLGGGLALKYALEHPDRVEALVLLSPAGARTSYAEWRALLDAFELESKVEALELLGRLYHRPPWFAPLLGGELMATFQRPAVRDLLATARPDDAPMPHELGSLPMPVYLLWGQSEKLMPPSHLAYFRQHLPAHAVIDEPKAFGHCPHLDDPARLADRIASLVRSGSKES